MSLKHPSPTDDDPSIKKRARINHDESRDAVDDGSGSDYDSDPEEDAYILRAAHEMATQAPTAGSVREAGSISKVILVQFMCHRHQVVELGPQINFVIGHNGSGKSAVLTAITLVLGAKATATNRGSSLKSFIREGQSKAEVTLHLTNRGDEAFKPEIYGDEIIIERSISKDGTSGYKIKASRDHRTVSTKRETLQTILDHFMIQADNPLNVLNQDAAKRFLNASSSKQKYEFFIRGTQLQQLTDEYEEINANIVMSKTLLDKKREDLPELYERAKSAQKTMKELEEASSAQDKISTLQHELTWIYVAEAQKQLESAQSELEKEERILPKYEAKVAETIARIAKLSDEISAIEARKAGRNDDVLDAQRVELTKKIRQRVEQIKAMNSEIRDSDTALKKVEGEISTQTKLIAEENAKSLRNSDSSRKQTIDQISQLSTEIDEFQASLFKAQHDMNQANDSVKSAKEHVNACHVELKRLTSEFELTQGRLREYENGRKDRILLFGRSADKLKSAIENNQGWVEKPIGPLGYYIQVKDKAWQPVIETVLSGSLNSYLVTNERDERLLRDLMARCQCKSPIIRSRRDLFDYSHGEPGEDYFTIFRALSFQDEYVKRALINDLRIEKTILVNHRRDGDPIMSQEADLRPNIESCYTRDGYRVGGIQGGKQSFGLTMYPGPPRLTRDDGSFSTELKQQAVELQAAIDNQRNLLSAAEAQARRSNEQVATAKRDERQLRDRLRKAQNTKASLQDDLDQNASSSVSALEDLKRELESERRKLFDQTKELVRQKEHLSTELGPIKTELEALQHQINNRQQEEEALNVELTQKITDKFTANEALKHFQDSLDRQIVKISQAKAAFEAASAELPKMIAQAKQITGSEEIVATTRPREKIISDLQELTKIVKQTESRHGTSLEEIENRCHDATTRYFKADKQIKEQSKSLKVLKMALALRKDRWIRFRTHIAVRAKMKFVTHLSKRGYTGKLNFNHSTQRLEIQVNTSEQDSTQGKLKDPKALSGGEKSFSTISLLLTLWDAINCPIRCLDEFDVFMDEVNRRIAVRMMIDSAKEANDVQYVFITPNGLSFIQTGPETKIIKMLDPTRNHGTLAAGQE